MIYNAADYGIVPGKDVTSQLTALIGLAEENSEINLTAGDYYLSSKSAVKARYHITNTMAEKEYDRGEKFVITIAILLKNRKNLTINGNNARFLIDGVMTHIVFDSCENVTVRDIVLQPENPDLHRIVAKKVSLFKAEFEIDGESKYVNEDGKIIFEGTDYRFPLLSHRLAWWHNSAYADDPLRLFRFKHPLKNAVSVEETSPNNFSAKGFFPKSLVKKGQEFYLFDTKRKQVGIFVDRSKNITLEGVTQTFNYSFAYAAQDCDTLTVRRCNFCPKENSTVKMTSLADFMHVCMCRGKVVVEECKFCGAGDDVLNVHGIYYLISEVGETLKVKYAHDQAYGFNPIRVGDTIAVFGRNTLNEIKRAKVITSKLVDLYTIELTLDTQIDGNWAGEVIEDLSSMPEVLFARNAISRISTRGILLTSGLKMTVKDNDFLYSEMPSIFVNCEAKYWFESGAVNDLTIVGNNFYRSASSALRFHPESEGITHRNISVKSNTFYVRSFSPYFDFKNTGNVVFSENAYVFEGKKAKMPLLRATGCEEIITDF